MLHKQIKKLEFELFETISEKTGDVLITVDSSRLKVTNRGEWMREMEYPSRMDQRSHRGECINKRSSHDRGC
jgi:hypothetical protein